MGGILNRSTVAQGNVKEKRGKRKLRHQQLRMSVESDPYFVHDGDGKEDSSGDYMQTYELWNDGYHQQKMMTINDAPGAPSTYSPHYSVTQNDMMTRSWSAPIDTNNSFYQINSFQMAPLYNSPYGSQQYNEVPFPNRTKNQSKTVMLEEQSSKKVQVSSSQEQQQTSTFKPLTNTQSWHRSAEISVPLPPSATKPVPSSDTSPVSRPPTGMPKTSSAKMHREKPIYIGIDYGATLAERGQPVVEKRRRKSVDRKRYSDGLNISTKHHRPRSYVDQPHQTTTDSTRTNIENMRHNSVGSLQLEFTSSQRRGSKVLPSNQLTQSSSQIPSINTELKPTESRSKRRPRSSVDNGIKPLKTRETHHRHHHHDQQYPTESSFKTQSPSRRMELNYSDPPVTRSPLSQLNQQQQPITRSPATSTSSVIRTRV